MNPPSLQPCKLLPRPYASAFTDNWPMRANKITHNNQRGEQPTPIRYACRFLKTNTWHPASCQAHISMLQNHAHHCPVLRYPKSLLKLRPLAFPFWAPHQVIPDSWVAKPLTSFAQAGLPNASEPIGSHVFQVALRLLKAGCLLALRAPLNWGTYSSRHTLKGW